MPRRRIILFLVSMFLVLAPPWTWVRGMHGEKTGYEAYLVLMCFLLSAFPWGWLADQLGPKKSVQGLFLVWVSVGGLRLMGSMVGKQDAITNLILEYLPVALRGIFEAGVFSILFKVMSTWTAPAERLTVLGVMMASIGIGFLNPISNAALALGFPVGDVTYYARGLLLTACFLVFQKLYADDARDAWQVSSDERKLLAEGSSWMAARPSTPWLALVLSPRLWLLRVQVVGLMWAINLAVTVHGNWAPWPDSMKFNSLRYDFLAMAAGAGLGALWRPSWTRWQAALLGGMAALSCGAYRWYNAEAEVSLDLRVALCFWAGVLLPIVWGNALQLAGRNAGVVAGSIVICIVPATQLPGLLRGSADPFPIATGILSIAATGMIFLFLNVARPWAVPRPYAAPAPDEVRLGTRLLCALAYAVPLFGPILLRLTHKRERSPLIRLHAWQSIFLLVLLGALSIVFYPLLLSFFAFPLLAILAAVLPRFSLPVLAPLAERLVQRLDRRAPAGAKPVNYQFRPLRWTGYPLIFGGLVIALASFILPDIIGAGLTTLSPSTGANLFLIGCYIGSSLIVLGQRLRTTTAAESLAATHAAPVLYLRSFKVDYGDEGEGPQWLFRNFSNLKDEKVLADLFSTIGPVVAIAQPGESIPRLGAARFYFADGEWRDGVLGLMQRASLVVLRVGSSKAFYWEVEQVLRLVDPRRVVFYFSHRWYEEELVAAYQQFVEATGTKFPHPLPANIRHERFLVFDEEWRPRLIGAVPVKGFSVLRFLLPGPLADFITLGRAHRRLALALQEWFQERGLATFPVKLFGLPSTCLGTFFSGPIAPTLMTAWNCFRIGRAREGAAWLGVGVLSLASLWTFYHWLHNRLIEASAGMRQEEARVLVALSEPSTINPILAVAFYFVGMHWRPRPVKEHFARGGAAVPEWLTILLIAAAAMAFQSLMPALSVVRPAR